MKKLEKNIARILVLVTYIFTFLLPVKKNRVGIISYFNNDYGLEFTKVVESLQDNNVIIKSNLHKFNNHLLGKFTYLFSFIKQTYLFNTCHLIIVDGNSFVHSCINKKKKVKVMQVWHATAAIKKFGSDLDTRRYKIKQYDYITVPSQYFVDIYAQAFSTPSHNIMPLGVMKTDYLFDKTYLMAKEEQFYLKNPHLLNKKIVLYAPTFRGEGIEDINFEIESIKELKELLPEEFQLIVRLHPLIRNRVSNILMMDEYDLYTMLYVSDIVISDYSALVYDASILKKKIILYTYDFEEYKNSRGLCVNLDEFPFKKAYNVNEMLSIINDNEEIDYKEFNDKYLTYIDGFSSVRISDYILEEIKKG